MRIWALAAALLSVLLIGAAAQAQAVLTPERAGALVSSLEELVPAMAATGGGKLLSSGRQQDMQRWVTGLQQLDAFKQIVGKYGFDHTGWTKTLGQVMEGYVAVQMQTNAPKLTAEVEQAKERILADRNMNEATKKTILKQLDHQMAQVKASLASGDGNSDAVAPYAARLATMLQPKKEP